MPMQKARLEAAKKAMRERLAKGIDISIEKPGLNPDNAKAT